MPTQFDLVLREETLANERRTVLTPEHVAKLTARGFKVALAHWPERVFSEKEYIDTVQRNGNQNNFAVIDPEDWKTQTPYENSLIVGVKEIVEAPIGSSQYGLKHIYIHFDHSYKGQQHAEERLGRFIGGYTPHLKDIFTAANRNSRSPLLLDHEYCVDENGQRTHAFGKSAGFATTAMSLMSWAQKINEEAFVLEQFSYDKKEKFFALLKSKMEAAPSLNQWPPKILVLGSERGRSARGCLEFIKELNGYLELKNPLDYDLWGRSETQNRQTSDGLDGITDFDVVINCTFAAQACEPFITDKTITNRHDPDRPIIIGDVTCDATPDKNRIR
nr:hypothetical protein [Micavibrio sp.]